MIFSASYTNIIYSKENPVILEIKKKFYLIQNSLGKYKKVQVDLQDFDPDDPGTLTAYFDGKNLRKIQLETGDNLHTAKEEFYFWDEELFFAYIKIDAYTFVPGNNIKSSEDRYYFKKGSLVKWIGKGGDVMSGKDAGYKIRESLILKKSDDFRKKISKNN